MERGNRSRRRSRGRGADADKPDPPQSSSADMEERIQMVMEKTRKIYREILEMTTIVGQAKAESEKKEKEQEVSQACNEARQVCRERYSVNIGHNGDVYPIGYHRSRTQDALDHCLELECQTSTPLLAKNSHGDRAPYMTPSKGYPFERMASKEAIPPESCGHPYRPRKNAYREDRDGCPQCRESRAEPGAKEAESKTHSEIYKAQSSHENVQRWLEGIRHHYGFPGREEDEKEVAAYCRRVELAQGQSASICEQHDRPLSASRINTSSKIDASNNLATFRSTFDVTDYVNRDFPPVVPRDTMHITNRTFEAERVSTRESVNEMTKRMQDIGEGGAIGGGGDVANFEGGGAKEEQEEAKRKEEGANTTEEKQEQEAAATGVLARKHSIKAVVKKFFLCCSRLPKGEEKFDKEKEREDQEKDKERKENDEEKEKKEEENEEKEEV